MLEPTHEIDLSKEEGEEKEEGERETRGRRAIQ